MKTKRIYAAVISVILAAGICTGAIYAADNKSTEAPQAAGSDNMKGDDAASGEKDETE